MSSLYHDPFEGDDEYIGVGVGDFAPYMKAVGNIAGSFMGGGQQGGAGGGTAEKLVQLQMMQADQDRKERAAKEDRDRQEAAARNRTILLVAGGVVGVGAIGTLIYFLTRKK